jgi:hypothetical protein
MRNRATRSYVHNAICDVCGFKMKNIKLRKRWDGFMVCDKDFELRSPLDFYTTRNDTHLLPWTRPESPGIDVGPVYINNTSAVAGIARAGIAVSGRTS